LVPKSCENDTRRIRAVNPGAKVEVRRIRLTGQESAASAASALDQVAACDLIVDATAEPNVFNLLASVSVTAKKPMV
jgi:sulfur-carrier protein adenylyltransferase/sulfurtransferase